MPPSGKMQTSSPLERFAGGFDRFARGLGRGLDGDRAHDLRQAAGPPIRQ